MEPVGYVRVAAEQKQQEEEERRKSNASIALDMTTTMIATDPRMLFLYALKAPATLDKYIQRLTKLLDSLGYAGTKEEKARLFAAQAKADPVYAFNSVLKFFQYKREQIDRKEIAICEYLHGRHCVDWHETPSNWKVIIILFF